MLRWRGYTADAFRRDAIAALTVAAVALPQGMAYALLAGVDPRYGLYSAIVVTAVASVFGSSSHLINGPTSAISLLVFAALSGHAQNPIEASEQVFLLAIMVGVIQIAIWAFRLGDLTRYISESVILGFMVAAATLLAVGQIANALGVRSEGTGSQHILYRLWLTLTQGDPVNSKALIASVATVALAILFRWMVRRFRWPQFDMFAGLLIVSIGAYMAGWTTPDRAGHLAVRIAGAIPASLPMPHIPAFTIDNARELVPDSLAIAFLGLLEALAIAKSIANETRQKLEYNRQCLAEGLANLTGGFFQCLPGSGSLSRSAINFQSGAQTRLSGILSAVIVAVSVLFLAPLARYVPRAALAALLLLTATRLIDYGRIAFTFRASRIDASIVAATAVAGLALGLDEAILIGVVLSILLFIPRAARLQAAELVVTPEGTVRTRRAADPISGDFLIYDLEGELFFGAAPELERIFNQIEALATQRGARHILLRLKRVRNPDVVSLELFEYFLKRSKAAGVTVWLASVRPDLLEAFRRLEFPSWLPEYRVFPQGQDDDSSTLAAIRVIHDAMPDCTPASHDELYYQV